MEEYRRNSFNPGLISTGLGKVYMDKENNNKVVMEEGSDNWLQRTFRRSKSEYRRKQNIIQVLPSASSSNLLQSGEEVVLRNKKRCRVLFSYQPVHDDELELKADQMVEFLADVEDGWWKGRVGGRVGVFPSNFVEMCSNERDRLTKFVEEKNRQNLANQPGSKDDEAKPMRDLGQKNLNNSENVTSLKPNTSDVMTTSERSIMGNKTPPDTAPRLPPKPVKDQCLVLFPYTAQNEDELTLEEGQMVTILTQEVEDKGWWKGELEGRVGVFPDNFVKRITQSIPKEVKEMKTQLFPSKQIKESPEKSILQTVKNSPLKDNKRWSDGQNNHVLSKAISVEKLKHIKTSDTEKLSDKYKSGSNEKLSRNTEEENKEDRKGPIPYKSEMPGSVKQMIKSDIFKVPNKPQAPKPKLGSFSSNRVSLSSITSGLEKTTKEYQRRVSEPAGSAELDVVAPTNKLSHPTASRVKAPKRRPPSQHFLKENVPDIDDNNHSESNAKNESKHIEEHNREATTVEVLVTATTVMSGHKASGFVEEVPNKESDSKPTWMEEFSRKKANRRSGVFLEKTVAEDSVESAIKPVGEKTKHTKTIEKPAPPKADKKPHLLQKPADLKTEELGESSKSFSREKSENRTVKKPISANMEEQEIKSETSKKERPIRPSLPPSLTGNKSSSKTSQPKRNSDLVRHSSELARPTTDKKHSDLVRKHSDSSRHSERALTEKTDKPVVHSTNLGKPEKFSFAKPEKPLIDKVMEKNERNTQKTIGGSSEVEKSIKTENYIGWRSDILEKNKVNGDILASREDNENNENNIGKTEKKHNTGSDLSKEV